MPSEIGSALAPCPRCPWATVTVRVAAWVDAGSGEPRRCVWMDEPVRCAAGCALTAADVRRLAVAVFRTHPAQLRLGFEDVEEVPR